MEELKRYELFLGALLHDIGKFFQRSDEPVRSSSKISEQAKGISDYICPVDQKGRLGYQHVIWTAGFLEKIAGKFKQMGLEAGNWTSDRNTDDNLVNLAIYHHKPNTSLQRLVQLADWWSSGLDRNKAYQGMTSNTYSDFRDVRLSPVFSYLIAGGNNTKNEDFKLSLKALTLDDDRIFPTKSSEGISDYEKLWEEFSEEFEQIPVEKGERGLEAFSETLLFLLKKYASVVPASTMRGEMPDTTLFDHLKSTAAISQSLFDYFSEKYPEKLVDKDFQPKDFFDPEKNPETEPPLLLFCGDINGIQKFIYNIASSKAAKSLKGRSFYIQLLTETIIQRILDDCKVSLAHIVYSSGGKFFMILPNTESVKTSLKNLKEEVEQNLFEIHNGELFVCMDFVEFGYNNQIKVFFRDGLNPADLGISKGKNLGPVWKLLFEKMALQKKKKFKNLFIEKFDQLFEPPEGTQDDSLVCAVTGIELKKEEARTLKKFGDEEVIVSQPVFEQTRIGHVLKDADFFITFREIGDRSYDAWKEKSIQPLNLKVHHYLFDESELGGDQSAFRFISSADVARVRRFNNTRFNQINKLKGKLSSYGFSFYGGNKQALNEGSSEYKTFDELAGSGDSGFRRLGVLRMDVDNLGRLFIEGIPEERKNLSVYSTLSNQLDLFFSGYINTIRNSEKFRDHVNILYSGGDDVFAVGRWDLIIEFAEKVRNDFRKFVCNREDISISGGIALVGHKFPLAKAAQMAGEAEDKAKGYGGNPQRGILPTKNAINLFGENIAWGDEFSFVKNLSAELYGLLKEGKIAKSLLQRFFIFRKIKEDGRQDWRWLSAYAFARYQKSNNAAKEELEKLKTLMITGSFENLMLESGELKSFRFETTRALDLLCIAARWADFRTRE